MLVMEHDTGRPRSRASDHGAAARRRRLVLVVAGLLALALLGGLTVHRVLVADTASAGDGGAAATSVQHENGQLPDDALVSIGDGFRLTPAPAEAFGRLEEAALSAGFTLQVNSAYRSLDEQVAMVEEHGLLSEGGLAAEPGTSEHGWGIAVDLTLDTDALIWFRTNAGRFGFVETIADEPWHWAYLEDGAP
jgi:D-alanyl-D-alanine carboxypeptidase